MKRIYPYDEQARHPHLPEEHYFTRLKPYLVYAGCQGGIPGPQNVLHTHPFVEIAFIHSGRGHVHMDGQDHPVQPGDLLIFDAGCVHCEYSDATDPLLFYFAAYDKISLPGLPAGHLLAPGMPPLLATGEMADSFCLQFREVLHELEAGQDFSYEIARGTAKIILMRLFRLLNTACNAKDSLHASPVLAAALRRIDEDPAGPLTLESLAEHCAVSKYHLAHLFTSQLGVSAGRYILQKRIYLARHLLGATDLAVEQIALQCGFADSAYFCRQFKKEMGRTPGQYRRGI